METEREGTNGMREPRRAKGIERDSTMRHGTDNNSHFQSSKRPTKLELPSHPRAKVNQHDSIARQLTPIVKLRRYARYFFHR